MPFELILAALGSCAVGLFIGWCGVAGFLLPILFTSACGLPVTESLLLSFLCFAVSGAIGSWNYHRRGSCPFDPPWSSPPEVWREDCWGRPWGDCWRRRP